MTTSAIFPAGRVDWSGENPGIYLKESPDGPWVTLMVFFRVFLSPHGRGHALVLLEAPFVRESRPGALNVCVTDNEPLTRWLVSEFVSKFASFRGVPALESMEYRRLTGVGTEGDQRASHVEWVKADGLAARLSWEGLGEPFMVVLPVEKSSTGRHEMYSLFVEAGRVTVTVNGRPVKGHPIVRDFLGRRMSSAFLAFSETWVRPPPP